MNNFVILFAGPVGSSKSPISNYLSYNLNLPVLNNDAIRTEVIEDKGVLDTEEYLRRRNARLQEVFAAGISIIYDASIDRSWPDVVRYLDKYSLDKFIISLDFSEPLLKKIAKYKGYDQVEHMYQTYLDHQDFILKNNSEVSISIGDSEFDDRLKLSLSAVKKWLIERL